MRTPAPSPIGSIEDDRSMTESHWPSTNSGTPSPVDRFLSLYWSDVDAGRKRSLKEYLEACPGDDLAVADEFVQCERPEADKTTILDRYRIVESLSSGGQGEVYAAIDHQIGRRVAVKKLHAKFIADPSAQKRLSREARTLGQLEHANICRIYDVVEDNGHIVVVMELIEGESFAQRIQRERAAEVAARNANSTTPSTDGSSRATPSKHSPNFAASSDPRTVLEFFRKIAAALQVAHDLKIVHRDLKPANIMVKHSGEPIIVDFGLAITLDESLSAQNAHGGTHGYMSPEQLTETSPHAIDARSDIFSLGVMLYEALTLEHPFGGATNAARDAATLNVEPRPPSSIRQELRRDVDAVVQCAMSKSLSRRYRTAAEFAKDLKRLLDGEPTAARPIGFLGRLARWSCRQPAKAALGAVLIVGVPTFASLLTAYLNDRPRVIEAERAETVRIQEGWVAKALVFQAQRQLEEADAIYEQIAANGPLPVEVACFHARLMLDRNDPKGALRILDRIDPSDAHSLGPLLTRAEALRSLGEDDEARLITNVIPPPKSSVDFILMAMHEISIARKLHGDQQFAGKLPKEARRSCETAILLSPRPRLYHMIIRGMCIVRTGDRDAALDTARALREHWPEQSMARFWAAALLEEFDDRSLEATIVENYRAAIQLDPKFVFARINLATMFQRFGRDDEAAEALREAEESLPHDPDVKCSIGILLVRRKRLDEAEKKFGEALDIAPSNARALVNLASLQIDRGQMNEAVASLRRAVDATPLDQATRATLAATLRKAGRPKDAVVEFRVLLRSDEASAAVHNDLGACLADAGELEESLKEYNRAIELDPRVATFHDNVGAVLGALGRSEEAVAAYRRAIEIDPKYINARRNLGATTLGMQRWTEAVEAFQTVLASVPDDRMSLSGIATAQLRLGRFEEAAASYGRCLEFDPTSLPLHQFLAEALRNSGRRSEAADVLIRASRLSPDDSNLRRQVGVMLMIAGRLDEAVEVCEKAVQTSSSDARLHDLFGLILLKQRRLERAVAEFREAIKIDPKTPSTLTRLSAALRQLGRIDEALAQGTEAVRLDPKIADSHVELSATLSIAGQVQESLRHARTSVELAPDDVPAQTRLGEAAAAAGAMDESVTAFRSACRLSPKDCKLHVLLGLVLYSVRRLDEGVEVLRVALDLDSTSAEAHQAMGMVLAAQSKSKEALAYFRDAYRLDPRLGEAYASAGRIESALKEYAAAESSFRSALRLDPDNPDTIGSYANMLFEQNRLFESLEMCRRWLSTAPNDAIGHRVSALVLAAQEKYEEALPHLESIGAGGKAEFAATQKLREAILTCREKLGRCKELQQRIDRYIEDKRVPESGEEIVELAREAERSGRFEIAASWYATALRTNAKAGGDVGARHRFRAARATLLTIEKVQDVQERSQMSTRAVAWIADDIRMIVDCFEDGEIPGSSVRRMIDPYLNDPIFEFLRSEKADGIPAEATQRVSRAREMLKELLAEFKAVEKLR